MSKRGLKPQSMTDWKHIDTMKDEDIDLSDIPELNDDFFREAELVLPQKQSPITISLDRDVWNGLDLAAKDTRL